VGGRDSVEKEGKKGKARKGDKRRTCGFPQVTVKFKKIQDIGDRYGNKSNPNDPG
jgi:hypothetical protein